MNMKVALVFFLLLNSQFLFSQRNMENLSASERIKLSEREQQEAAMDNEFLLMMDEAHKLFSNRHYLKAIHKYEEAREKRPYNVYPKVKITDIELSMKDTLDLLREQEKKQQQEKKEELKEDLRYPERPDPEVEKQKEQQRQQRVDEWEQNIRANRERQREKEDEPQPIQQPEGEGLKTISVEEFQEEMGRKFPDGITESSYVDENNRKITRRVVVKNGKGNDYKKIEHSWGGVFYFKNGQAISETTWKEETKKSN